MFYGEQILLGMEGPFLDDDNNLDDDKKATNQVTVQLMGGARAIDVSIQNSSQVEHFEIKLNLKYNID